MNFTGSSKPLILIHKNMPLVEKSEGLLNAMLTPQFYTLKKEELSVKYSYQAKKLAPSILESLLKEGVNYDYFVFKEEDSWVFVAYDPIGVSEFLSSKGIGPQQVSKLFFAQQVAEKFAEPVALDENEALVLVNGTAAVLPKVLLEDEVSFGSFDETFAPKAGVTFGAGTGSIIGRKESWVIGTILLLFALMFCVEGMRYNNVSAAMQDGVSELLKDYPSLQSQYTRDNIAQSYRKIDQEERQKREVLKALSGLMLPGVKIESLHMDSLSFGAEFLCPDENSITKVRSLALGRKYKVSRSGDTNLVKVEGAL